ncbi:probable RNA polymerase II nuclear localization protein SLC7A6OS [Haliotis rufescens]|uniref:probable RNA polymerase II nuclear localization protein SLC7A6OS n=1 Tax=Haliotis rufescens TaxID=6454 RepID=UPI001EB0407C|nr:probable RNA polymerase II nuclear localization protein SLC7A6OS [Haliotis rufescens]
MAAIVRVKRRRSVEPVESLVFSSKKLKENDIQEGTSNKEITGLLKFAGTVPIQETNVSTFIREAIKKDKLRKEYKSHTQSHDSWTVRQRNHRRQQSTSNRYKVVSSLRSPQLDRLDLVETGETGGSNQQREQPSESTENRVTSPSTSQASNGVLTDNGVNVPEKMFCLFDVEEEAVNHIRNASASTAPAPSSMYSNITCNSVPMIREAVARPSESEYVYDLYYTNSQQFDFRQLQDFLTIQAFGDELVFADSRADEEEFVEVYDDEDDSNDEGNWRNDYPEEDPHFIENHEQEYSYGDDDVGHHRYDTGDPLASFMAASCNIRTGEAPRDDVLEYDVLSGPQRSYKSYYRSMLQDLGEDMVGDGDDEDEDDNYDVR